MIARRRVCAACDGETSAHRKHGFVEQATRGSGRDGKDREGVAIGEGGRDVITNHTSLRRVRQPGQIHWSAGERGFG